MVSFASLRMTRTTRCASRTAPEQQHVPIPYHVLLALGPREPSLARRLPPAHSHEVVVGHRLRPDEPLLEIGVDHAGGGRRRVPAMDGPGPHLFLAGREVALEAQQVIRGV